MCITNSLHTQKTVDKHFWAHILSHAREDAWWK